MHSKNLNVERYVRTFQPGFFFMPFMLIDPIDTYHFIPLPLALTFAEGHKVNGTWKQSL